jgi:hypothetical protein
MSDWQKERLMTPRQYKMIIKELGLNKASAGRYVGVSGRTSHRYVSGDAEIPIATALLLRSLVAHGETPVVPKWKRGDN